MIGALVAAVAQLAFAANPVGDVRSIDARGDVELRVAVGAKSASVDADPGVEIAVEGGVLRVTAPKKSAAARPLVSVSAVHVDSIEARDGARVSVTGVSRAVVVNASGTSTVTLAGKGAPRVAIGAAGSAHVDADGLMASALDVKLDGAARAEARVANGAAVTVDLAKASRLSIKGKPGDLKKKVGGVAKLVLE